MQLMSYFKWDQRCGRVTNLNSLIHGILTLNVLLYQTNPQDGKIFVRLRALNDTKLEIFVFHYFQINPLTPEL